MSALISAASPEKMDRYTKLRTASGTMNIHQQSSPLGDHKYRGVFTFVFTFGDHKYRGVLSVAVCPICFVLFMIMDLPYIWYFCEAHHNFLGLWIALKYHPLSPFTMNAVAQIIVTLLHHRVLVIRLLLQGYKVNCLSNTFKKFYGRHTSS